MENRLFKGLVVVCFLLIGSAVLAQTSKNPVGVWDFSVPDAPTEYATGKIEFKNQDGKLLLFFVGNNQTRGFEVTRRENQLVCRVSQDGFVMTLTLNPDGDNLKGTVDVDQWKMAISMKPAKK